jgi:predicted  nucleic acid-binding Zn-ribbon protein
MLPKLNIADGPLSGRITEGFDSVPDFVPPGFNAQTVPVEFIPLPAIQHPDPVGNFMGVPRPASVKDTLGAVTKMLMDVEASEARDGLMREWMGLSEKVTAFLAEAQRNRVEALKRHLAELNPLCRASLDRLRMLQDERRGMDGQMHALEEPLGQANLKYRVAVAEKPSDDAFPTETEIAEWQDRVAKAQAAVDRAAGRVVVLREHMARKDFEVRTEAARLADLKRRREDTKAQLEGRERRGPFGMVIPATK